MRVWRGGREASSEGMEGRERGIPRGLRAKNKNTIKTPQTKNPPLAQYRVCNVRTVKG